MKLKIFLPIAAVALLLFGVVLLALTVSSPHSELVKDVTLSDTDVTQETLETSANGLIPGDSREYTLNFKGQSSGNYTLKFQFVELNDGALKDSVKVTFVYGDKSDEYDLAYLLKGNIVTLNIKVLPKQATTLKLIYSIPLTVGNEAQNATADFVINLSGDKN